MARAIKDTPVLEGKEAEKFDRMVKANENKIVPKNDYDRAKNVYERIKKNSKSFQF